MTSDTKLSKEQRREMEKLALAESVSWSAYDHMTEADKEDAIQSYEKLYLAGVASERKRAQVLHDALEAISNLPKGTNPTELDAIYAIKKASAALFLYQKGTSDE